MASKKNKGTIARASIVVEEPVAGYAPSSQGLRWVHGAKAENTFVRRSVELMGLQSQPPFNKVKNLTDFITCIREGVPKKALDNIMEVTGISAIEMSTIIRTSDRTLRRYSSRQKLNAEQSERVIELAKIFSRGEEVFGSLTAFREWMSSSVLALGNQKPKDFLDTSLGIEMLMDELGRIEHGIFA